MNGGPLLPQHGFPLRLVVPGWYGMTSVKWLTRITVVDRPFEGHQQAHAYRFRRDEDDPGTPLTRIFPRALMIPPGLAGFPERERTLAAGPTTIEGRAWSGWAEIERSSSPSTATWTRGRARPAGRPLGLARLARRVGRDARRARPLLPRPRRGRQRAAGRGRLERRRLRQQRRPARAGHRHVARGACRTRARASAKRIAS